MQILNIGLTPCHSFDISIRPKDRPKFQNKQNKLPITGVLAVISLDITQYSVTETYLRDTWYRDILN
jgi:hypothetical protein